MRSDFSDQHSKNKRPKSKWPKPRILRALIFILIGVAVGFWLNQKPKSAEPKSAVPLAVEPTPAKPERVTQTVELPVLDYS